MSRRATITSKGQVTIPVEVRRALGLREGDQVVFEIEDDDRTQAQVARVRRAPDFLAMAGAVPPRKRLPKTWAKERRLAIEEAIRQDG